MITRLLLFEQMAVTTQQIVAEGKAVEMCRGPGFAPNLKVEGAAASLCPI